MSGCCVYSREQLAVQVSSVLPESTQLAKYQVAKITLQYRKDLQYWNVHLYIVVILNGHKINNITVACTLISPYLLCIVIQLVIMTSVVVELYNM